MFARREDAEVEIVTLRAVSTIFYSQYDEDMFFKWLNKIRCVETFGGEIETLNIAINKSKLTDIWLRELLALFYRYEVEMTQLRIFETEKNKHWFSEPEKYWHKLVYKEE